MEIKIIIITSILCIVMLVLMFEAVKAVKKNNIQFAIICTYSASLIGFLLGLCLGNICFGG